MAEVQNTSGRLLLILAKDWMFFYHVTYVFYSESTLCSCLNVKELLTQKRRDI